MKNEELIEQIMNWLAGELSPAQEQDLWALLAQQPDIKAQAEELKRIWDTMDQALPPVQEDSSALKRVYLHVVLGQDPNTLDDEDLDKAAGGIRPYNSNKPNPDSSQENF